MRPIVLELFEYRHYSQNYEDGVIEEIFFHIGSESQYYVEFGGSDGLTDSNTRWLKEQGWKGLMMDMSHENPSLNLRKEFVTAENINALFEKYDVPPSLDFLCIDIDSNDFYVWQALENKYRPRLVMIEVNGTFLPGEDRVVLYNPKAVWDGTYYHGASIQALYNLGQSKGYSLVYAESTGSNLFFVRKDLLPAKEYFKECDNVEKLYKRPTYGRGPNGGHLPDPLNRPFIASSRVMT